MEVIGSNPISPTKVKSRFVRDFTLVIGIGENRKSERNERGFGGGKAALAGARSEKTFTEKDESPLSYSALCSSRSTVLPEGVYSHYGA